MVQVNVSGSGFRCTFSDNFMVLETDADSAQAAYDACSLVADNLMQALSVLHGNRFSAVWTSIESADGVRQLIKKLDAIPVLQATIFNTQALQDRIAIAVRWADISDQRLKKAFLYFEHACLLREFAQSLQPYGAHAAFSNAMAFLQLFKALTAIVGEPGTDLDYQRRAKELGLGSDFWRERVKPLYLVRNDDDVAHYSLEMPDSSRDRFGEAAATFKDAAEAYISTLDKT